MSCCEHLTLTKRGWYSICPVCFWERPCGRAGWTDRSEQSHEGMTLHEGRANFVRLGASNQRRTKLVPGPPAVGVPAAVTETGTNVPPVLRYRGVI
jgi:hypothetical protein